MQVWRGGKERWWDGGEVGGGQEKGGMGDGGMRGHECAFGQRRRSLVLWLWGGGGLSQGSQGYVYAG